MQVSNESTNQSISDADVHDALDGERTKIEESRKIFRHRYKLFEAHKHFRLCLHRIHPCMLTKVINESHEV